MKTSRRKFIQDTAFLAAGAVAVAGIGLGKGIRHSGKVKAWVEILGPLEIAVDLFADDENDLLGIRCLEKGGGEASLSLKSVRQAVLSGRKVRCQTEVWKEFQRERCQVELEPRGGFFFITTVENGCPFWFELRALRWVV